MLALRLLVASFCMAILAWALMDRADRNVEGVEVMKLAPCLAAHSPCAVDVAPLRVEPTHHQGEDVAALVITPDTPFAVALDGLRGRSHPWSPVSGTVLLWFRPDGWNQRTNVKYLLSAGTDGPALELYVIGDRLELMLHGEPTTIVRGARAQLPAWEAADGRWHHVAASWHWDQPEHWVLALDGTALPITRVSAGEAPLPRSVTRIGAGHYIISGEESGTGAYHSLSISSAATRADRLVALITESLQPEGSVVFSLSSDARTLERIRFWQAVHNYSMTE